jgi:hypothetical protein
MKIFKIALILSIPVLGLVSCEKSKLTCNPSEPDDQTTEVAGKDAQPLGKAAANGLSGDDNTKGSTIVGSGDDDREGGDKKLKQR